MNRINGVILGFVLAWASLTYELVLAQSFVDYAIETAVWYPIVIAFFLMGLLLGVLKTPPAAVDEAVASLIKVEMALAFLGAVSVFVLAAAHFTCAFLLLHGQATVGLVLFYAVGLIMVLAIGALTGRELPLLLNLVPSEAKLAVIAADYWGALAAGLFFVWIWFPHCEPFQTALVTAAVNLGIVVVLCRHVRNITAAVGAMLSLTAVGAGLVSGPALNQILLKYFYYYPAAQGREGLRGPLRYPDIDHDRSLYQTLDLVHIPPEADPWFIVLRDVYSRKYIEHPDQPQGWMFYLNRDFQWWADAEEIYHEYLAHVPILLAEKVPRTVLVIGGGDGLLVRELLKYPSIKHIDLVDIDARVVDWARTHPVLRALNGGALSDDRVEVIIDDGFRFVKQTDRRYDAVFLDVPTPDEFNTARLYSMEFYRRVRRLLNRDGFLALDAPGLTGFDGDDEPFKRWRVYAATLHRAGFDQVMPYFSRLEEDHPEAWARLNAVLPEDVSLRVTDYGTTGTVRRVLQGRREVGRQIIKDHCDNMANGFIMACPIPCHRLWHWERLPSTYVLNVFRAQRALLSGEDFLIRAKRSSTKKGAIHSVWRPRLPRLDEIWAVRIPY